MKKKFAQNAVALMVILFACGLILIFSSTALGQNEGSRVIQANGGSMDTAEYQRTITSVMDNCRMAGAIISLVGGLGVLLSGYGLFLALEHPISEQKNTTVGE